MRTMGGWMRCGCSELFGGSSPMVGSYKIIPVLRLSIKTTGFSEVLSNYDRPPNNTAGSEIETPFVTSSVVPITQPGLEMAFDRGTGLLPWHERA